jgi:polyhydroxyalkanoate synthase
MEIHEKTGTRKKNRASFDVIDRYFNASVAKFTKGISPASLSYAFLDWWQHLSTSPSKQIGLETQMYRQLIRLSDYNLRTFIDPRCENCIEPLPQDTRFTNPEWKRWPYKHMVQSFLLSQQWWHKATTNVRGVSKHHSEVVSFAARQILDFYSPSNYVLTNPDAFQVTLFSSGINLLLGFLNYIEDTRRNYYSMGPVGTEAYVPGKTVAITPGKVVYRNSLIELIQYAPTTDTVYAEPVLIAPAWIMKYYILDLSPKNSLVKYLRDQGFTVFMISWKNPTRNDEDAGMADYLEKGIKESLRAIKAITNQDFVHCAGYCIGGALLSIASSAMARDGDHSLKTITLLTAQTDYTEVGELGLFIDESQLTFLEDVMWEQGYLDAKQLSGAFQLLHSKDLIFSRITENYLLGKRQPITDLMAWNADATRLPYHMHSEYLRSLYLNNDLTEGRYRVAGHPITLHDIRTPMYVVATQKDHISPWRSVYKIHLVTETEVTFVLTTGGHNAGIISEPGHLNRSFQVSTQKASDPYIDPNEWQKHIKTQEGSWWIHWSSWLKKHSSQQGAPPPMGKEKVGYRILYDAPGKYVLEK